MIFTLDLFAALSTLTELEREVLLNHALLGDTQAEIADSLGCSRSNVYLVERRAVRKMRVQLAGRERPSAYEMLAAA